MEKILRQKYLDLQYVFILSVVCAVHEYMCAYLGTHVGISICWHVKERAY